MLKKSFEFKASTQGNDVVIEGWANKGIVDSANDLMKYDNVEMSRFEKNPILFFNHDWNTPVGKILEHKLSETGLWVKAKLSKSDNPVVSYVRDLVQEGILKTFSIGFDVINKTKDAAGTNIIDKWELHEISIVTLPCNIDSEFALAKSLKKCKQYLHIKGAKVAEYLSQFELSEEQHAKLEELSKLSKEDIAKVFSGEMTPVPQDFLAAFAVVASLSDEQKEELAKLADEEKPIEKPSEENLPPADKPEDKPEEQMSQSKDDAFDKCVEEKIPQLINEGMEREQAVAVAIKYCQEKGLCKKEEPVPPPQAPISTHVEDSNAILDLAKAQLAMLGSIVAELKALNAAIEKLTVAESKPEQEEVKPAEDSSDEMAKILLAKNRLKKIMEE